MSGERRVAALRIVEAKGDRTGGTQEFSPSPTFHPGLQRIVSDTRANIHVLTRMHRARTHTSTRSTGGAHSYARARSRSAVHVHTRARPPHPSCILVDHAARSHTRATGTPVTAHTWSSLARTYARAHTYTHMCTRCITHTCTHIHRLVPSVPPRLLLFLSRPSSPPWTAGPSVVSLPPRPPSPAISPFALYHPHLNGEHSLANLPYTFVCLNWVAFYTRAWSVNRILNYYSDCVLPAPRYLPGPRPPSQLRLSHPPPSPPSAVTPRRAL